MASSGPLQRRNSIKLPPTIADVVRLKAEFIELYARDHPQLQQCLKELQEIFKTFEKDFRGSTKGSRTAGWLGIFGGTAIAAGLGLALAPFTMGASAVFAGAASASVAGAVAAAVVGAAGVAGVSGTVGVVTLAAAGFKSYKCRSEKKEQMDRLRKDIESELQEFQDKISPMAEKMKDLHECTKKIMRDFKNLEKDASDLTKKLRIEELAGLTEQMSENMRLITSIAMIYGGFSLVLDMISVFEYSRALDDMDKLAQKPVNKEIDESEIRSKAGKFIAEMRKSINQLQNIIDELEKTKHKLADF